nr:DUF4357 domain-containing protein [Adlercreutzia sp. ZJ473]
MSTVVPGLVKIGKTQTKAFESRMYQLERNGYNNIAGLKREFAIEVENYDEKESLLDDIFSRSRVYNSELFAIDVDLVIQLLSSFEGVQVFPPIQRESKEETFAKATAERKEHVNAQLIPDGIYCMARKLKKDGGKELKAEMVVEEGRFIIKKGQRISLAEGAGLASSVRAARCANVDVHGIVISDVVFDSPSTAGSFIIGASCNGWVTWKTKEGTFIDSLRA